MIQSPMSDVNQRFPSATEAVFLIIGLMAAEYVVGALFHDSRSFSGIEPRDMRGVIALLGNGILFSALVHYKQLSYRSLFHPSSNSVTATLAVLSVPILMLIPALILVNWTLLSVLVSLIPLSRWEQSLFEQMSSNDFATIVAGCVLAPVLEEMLFRGIILRSFLLQYSRTGAMLGSAALFGLAHLNIYQFVVALLMGIILAWLYERARSLWPCILCHAAYNSAITLNYSQSEPAHSADPWQLSLFAWALSFIVAFMGAYWLKRVLAPSGIANSTVGGGSR